MCRIISDALLAKLQTLKINSKLPTPDEISEKSFTVNRINSDSITIIAGNGTSVELSFAAFIDTMKYLICNGHDSSNPVEIRAHNVPSAAGPLCLAARARNNNVRSITYTLPILEEFGFVGISGARPNSCWYL